MSLYETYKYLFYDLADPRWKNNILIVWQWPIVAIIAAYLYFTKVYGPKMMKNRQPYDLQRIMKIYNFIQILWNIYMISYAFPTIRTCSESEDCSWRCLLMNYSEDNELSTIMLSLFTHYFYNKLFDLTDTIFLVLRKKDSHVTFTHVYHHASMCVSAWLSLKYGAGGNPTVAVILNTFVHSIMYTYYQLAAMKYNKYLWWKKNLTQIQLLQFVLIFSHNLLVYFDNICYYNPLVSGLVFIQPIYFIYLFSKLYVKTYSKKKER